MSSKKLIGVVPEGEETTKPEKTPVLKRCLGCCVQVCGNCILQCGVCESGCYCSTECAAIHKPDHQLLCSSIVSLTEYENAKESYRQRIESIKANSPIPYKLNQRIISLVGERPVLKATLSSVHCDCLWDTGSMVSMISESMLVEMFPDKTIYTVNEFVENGGGSLNLSAANNTKVPVEGVVLLDFHAGVDTFQIPFLVTKAELSNPILGFNTIAHLILNVDCNKVPEIMKLLPQLATRDQAKVFVNTIEEATGRSEVLGTAKSTSVIRIPGKCMVRVKAKTRVPLDGDESKEFLFDPLFEFAGDSDLIVYESTGVLKRGKTQFVEVGIYNPTASEIFLKKGTVLGHVVDVATVIRFPMSVRGDSGGQKVGVNSVKAGTVPEDLESGLDKIDLSHLSEKQRKMALAAWAEEEDAFSREKNDIGFIPDFEMPINLVDNVPVSEPYRQIPRMLYDEVKAHISNLLANGWIRQSQSAYSSPMVCVRKKDGSLRLCIDYRGLNRKTIPDKQPIPRVQDLLDGLGGQKWFTTLDMSQAYHQGQIREESRKLTAFSTPWSLYEWVRIPYGLMNAPPCFQRYINDTLFSVRDRICVAYLDDILIYGKTLREHIQNVKTVLGILRGKGIKLNPKKCVFAKQEVRYLGRLISKDGYRPDPENAAALNACKEPPKTVGKLRSLLGFLGYYRGFVQDFSRKMKPIYDLLKFEEEDKKEKGGLGKKSKKKKYLESRRSVEWTPKHQQIVNDVVDYLQSPAVIAYPDFKEPFMLHCDASQDGLGAVLYQRQEGKTRVISFASRTLTPAEKNYHLHSGKLEFLALKWAVCDRFSDYLHYGPAFEIFTDNNPLTYLLTTAKLNASGLRWVSQLANYQFSIKYRAGKKHIDADYLSRHPLKCFEQCAAECTQKMNLEEVGVIFSEVSSNRNVNAVHVDVNVLSADQDVVVQKIPVDELIGAQREDKIIQPVYDAVVSGGRSLPKGVSNRASRLLFSQMGKLSLENGVLTRNLSTHKQIVLPSVYHNLVYEELHQKLGHLGSEKVVELARRRFFWPYMKKEIEQYVRHRCRCIISKKPNASDRAPLVPIEASSPFELVSMDFLHLDRCAGGFEYALIVCDHFTRFVQIFPTRNKKAKTVADHIYNKYILNYGFPRRIHHDQGGEFNNRLFRKLHELAGIKTSRTTPYHPMGDGQPERFNRTLINMLKCLNENEKGRWKDHVAKLAFAYNATINKSTGFSPFYLMFGREVRLPIDVMFGIEEGESCGSKTYDQFVTEWRTSMKKAVDIAQANLGVGKAGNKARYDRKVRGVAINVGDNVLLRNLNEKGGTGKLKCHWENKVYEVVGVDPLLPVYTIKPKVGGPTKKVHRNNIMNCNLLLPEQVDKGETLVHPNERKGSVPAKKGNKICPSPRNVQVVRKSQLSQPQKKDKHVVFAPTSDDTSSSEDDVLVCAIPSERGEEDGRDIENSGELIRDDDLDATVPYAEKDVEGYIYDVDSESEVEEQVSQVPGTELREDVDADTESEESDSSDVSESTSAGSSEVTDTDTDTGEQLRRTTRPRRPPALLTYDELGIPVVQR